MKLKMVIFPLSQARAEESISTIHPAAFNVTPRVSVRSDVLHHLGRLAAVFRTAQEYPIEYPSRISQEWRVGFSIPVNDLPMGRRYGISS